MLTVPSNDQTTRERLLAGIRQIAEHVGGMNGLSGERLPEVRTGEESMNDQRPGACGPVARAFADRLGGVVLPDQPQTGMGPRMSPISSSPKPGCAPPILRSAERRDR